MKSWLACGLLALVVGGTSVVEDKPQDAAAASKPVRPAAKPADVESIDTIIAALYDVISGPAGKARDWDRMRSLFVNGAHLIATFPTKDGAVRRREMTPDDYIKGAGPMLEKDGFFERESARKMDRFGPIAQIFSTYESRHKAEDAQPFARGINSIQVLFDGKRWWIVSVLWCAESDTLKVPAEYSK